MCDVAPAGDEEEVEHAAAMARDWMQACRRPGPSSPLCRTRSSARAGSRIQHKAVREGWIEDSVKWACALCLYTRQDHGVAS